jgi:arylsulfatase A-like enzyme
MSTNLLCSLWLCGFLLLLPLSTEAAPNIVLIYCDDLGYADVGCFGAKGWKTPNLDQMAQEGVRCTDFHTAAAVCSASRAALLTGCYPQRVGILGALGPNAKHGIADSEKLLPELLKKQGYATAIFGKWHLGHHPEFLPLRHGFDKYFGLPYSNDMWPNHPTSKTYPPLPLIDGETTIETNPDQSQLTTWYTERAVKFIEEHRKEPFFVYVPHNMPHVPLFVSDKFKGKSEQGLYGDVIMEIDWSVGQILATLKRLNLDDNTLVMFSSDNGPWLSYGSHAGSAGIYREGKGTTWEGGQREPFIARWPGKIPAGKTCDEFCATIDIMPTCVKLAGGSVPDDRIIDGKDIWPLLTEAGAKSPHDVFYYYWDTGLDAIRSGEWKLHFPHAYRSLQGAPGKDGMPNGYVQAKTELALYNLQSDPSEKTNVAAEHPDVVARLQKLAEVARDDLGDSLTKRAGRNIRPAQKLKE